VASLRDVDDAARVYGPARIAAGFTLALMILAALYAIRISIANWSQIGV